MRGFWLELFAICVVVQIAAANRCTVCDKAVICLAKEGIKNFCPQGRPCTEQQSAACKELIQSAKSRLPTLYPAVTSFLNEHGLTGRKEPFEFLTRGGPALGQRGDLNMDLLRSTLDDVLESIDPKLLRDLSENDKKNLKKLCRLANTLFPFPPVKKICGMLNKVL